MEKKPLHLLILEDNPDEAELAVKELERGGFTLEWSRVDTEKAFREALDEKPDLILADYKLPSFSGLAALKVHQEIAPDIPLIIFSGTIGEEFAVECITSGAIDYVLKDRLFRLGPAVKRALEEAEEHRARKRAEKRIQHLNSILKAIRRVNRLAVFEKDRDILLQKICDALIDARGYDGAWLSFLKDEETFARVVGSGLGENISHFSEHVLGGDHPPCIRNALAQKHRLMVVDKSKVCGDCFFKSPCIGREAAIIRIEHADRLFGLLAILFAPDVTADEEEKGLLKEVASDIAFALHAMEFEEARKQAKDRIEHLNSVLRAIRSVNQLITKEKNRDRLIKTSCDNLIRTRGYYNAWMVLLDENGELITTAESGLGKDFFPMAEMLKNGKMPHCGQRALKQSELVVTEDPLSTCTDCPLSKYYSGRGAMTIRLEHRGRVYGLVSASIPRDFLSYKEEQSLFQELGGDIAFALYSIELEKEHKQTEEEQKKLETQLQQSQKLESIGRLAGGVAHDFNNILTVIMGNAELLSINLGKDNPLQDRVKEISKGGERATSLTRQLLAFSRRQVLQPQVLDLNSVIPNIDKMLRRLIGEDIDLKTILAPDLGRIEADPGQIEQVLMNLAVNSRDAMPTGGKLTIETANVDLDESYARKHIAVKPGPYVMMAISDIGKGMDKETMSNIFEPFFTTKEKGKGTGLGLSMVYGIVKQSGGNIWVYSEPKKGTIFKIYLPRVEKVAETDQKVKATPESLKGSETILVVEDDKMVRDMAKSILQKYGYSILDAQDGESAITLSEKHKGDIHLMLTDVVMPGMSGSVLAERLAGKRPKMKVLFMSGYTDNAIVHHGVLGKEMNFLQKPFTIESLAKKVREVLDS